MSKYRNHRIVVRCTAEQKQMVAVASAREGLAMSTWLLSLGLKRHHEGFTRRHPLPKDWAEKEADKILSSHRARELLIETLENVWCESAMEALDWASKESDAEREEPIDAAEEIEHT